MSKQKIWAMYFSPTGTTKKLVTYIAGKLDPAAERLDFTLPEARQDEASFTSSDVVFLGVPVYAGRVPNVLLNYLNTIEGNGALAVPIVVYGNRNYDDALIELQHIMEDKGFHVVAAAAFVGEHSFSKILAAGRPDETDLALAEEFAGQINLKRKEPLNVKGNDPIKGYYQPRDRQGNPVNILKVKPKTADTCTDCKICAKVCPMGSIDYDQVDSYTGICIKCGACVKKCPEHAKYYDDENYLYHQHELEEEFTRRAEPEWFV